MPCYQYESINKQGRLTKGQLESENLKQAVEKLHSMSLIVTDLKEAKPDSLSSFFTLQAKVTIGDVTLFSRQLAAMIGAGIPVTQAISALGKQAANRTLKSALENIASSLDSGMSLTDAFRSYPDIFSDLYISMIHAGEVGGKLENVLLRLSEQLQKDKILKDEVKSATAYPKVISIAALCIFVLMMIIIVPVFKGMISKDIALPAITRFIFAVSDSIRNQWYFWIAALAAITAGILTLFKNKTGKDLWERFKLTLPIFGPIIQKSVIARFTRTLSTLMEGGIPVVQAMESAGPTSGSDIVNNTVKLAVRRIEEGKTIASTLEESGVFPPMVTQMIKVGEETGELPSLLDKVAEFYEQEVSTATKGLQTLIQPVAIILIGFLIGGMLISLYLPIFSSITTSGGGL